MAGLSVRSEASAAEGRTCLLYFKEQKHFVLVPADKAKNNVLIVCKHLDVVTREFCNVDSTGPRTYDEEMWKNLYNYRGTRRLHGSEQH